MVRSNLIAVCCYNSLLQVTSMRKLLNIDQVAGLFGVSKRTIEGWIRDGKLPKPVRRFGIRKWNSEQLEPLRKSGRSSEQHD
jgi:excisionase family DNA binding protein